jgi:drug/metabolite transporter (DMT)-like permease
MLAGILPWIVTAPSPIDGAPPLAVHASGHTSTLIAVVAAFAAALGFALASVWQQQAAASVPAKMTLSPRLLLTLARRPIWLAGIGAGVVSIGLQALALAFGPLTLVQPLLVTDLVFAMLLGMRRSRQRLGMREWAGMLAVVAGLAIFLLAARPYQGKPDSRDVVWLVIELLALVAAGAAVAGGRSPVGVRRAILLAAAAGTLFGLQSALLRTVSVRLGRGILQTLTSWHPYALAVVAIAGVLCSQSAFQAGPVGVSLPVIDTLEPSVAILIGAVAFGEHLAYSPGAIVLEIVSWAVIIAGVIILDRSPVILDLQQQQSESRDSEQGSQELEHNVGQSVSTPTVPRDGGKLH